MTISEKVTMKLLYEKLDETKKEERGLRHEQATRFQTSINTMNEQNEKRFDKLEVLINEGFKEADTKFATKAEHKDNSNKIKDISKNIDKLNESDRKIMNLKNSIM
jgi:DNA anti-recombination protein RmuC